jgi:hypothetical protein
MANQSTQENKSELALASVIDLLLAAKFIQNGHTREEIVRIPTAKSPLLGKSGGELAKFGGRQRFEKSGTNIKATVGIKTTYFYFVQGVGEGSVKGIATHNTKDIEAIKSTIASLCV